MRVAIGAVFFSAAVKSLRNLHRVANAAYDVPQVYEILELRRRICMDILRGKDRLWHGMSRFDSLIITAP